MCRMEMQARSNRLCNNSSSTTTRPWTSATRAATCGKKMHPSLLTIILLIITIIRLRSSDTIRKRARRHHRPKRRTDNAARRRRSTRHDHPCSSLATSRQRIAGQGSRERVGLIATMISSNMMPRATDMKMINKQSTQQAPRPNKITTTSTSCTSRFMKSLIRISNIRSRHSKTRRATCSTRMTTKSWRRKTCWQKKRMTSTTRLRLNRRWFS